MLMWFWIVAEAERRVMRMYQAGLVLEGGGMKGVYTAGVLDFFTEKGIDFSHIYGVSAGACHMCSYLSRQKGRALSVSVDYLDTRRYCSLESLLTSGDLFNVDFCYHLIPDYLYPYDYDTFEKYPGKAYSVVTNIETGQPEYLRVRDIRKDIDKIRASASLPLVARNVKIDGKLYLDGGISDAIPLEKSILDGNRKNILVMTKEVGFVRKPASASQLGLIKLRYLKYPKVYELMADRHIRYNECLDYIDRQEKNGQAFVIRPHKKSDVGRIEKDKDKLIALYEEGYRKQRTAMKICWHISKNKSSDSSENKKDRRNKMLEIIKAIIYGIVEGITEWLPISSTGHLILVERLIPFQETSEGFFDMFDVVIQLGAILAVVVLFWNKIWPFYMKKNQQTKKGGIVRSKKDFTVGNVALSMDAFWMWVKIVVACIPAVVYGLLFDDAVSEAFKKEIGTSGVTIQVIVVAVMLVLVGVLFIVIENWNKNRVPTTTTLSQLTYRDALIIGFCQLVAAALPGTSRSGATILGAIMIGISRTVAAEFTFFLAIPVMFGASLLKVLKFGFAFTGMELACLLVGTVISFIVSLFVLRFLMGYIKKHDFKVFGWYRIVLGIIVLLYFLVFA
jgi:undecaprenyl-diphosphatase UppP